LNTKNKLNSNPDLVKEKPGGMACVGKKNHWELPRSQAMSSGLQIKSIVDKRNGNK
jgi:hypothetical protein